MKTYDEIKAELLEIADVLNKYPDSIQPQVFDILTKHFLGDTVVVTDSEAIRERKKKTGKAKVEKEENEPVKQKAAGKTGGKSKESYTILKDLDLRGTGGASFKSLFEEKKPKTATEFNSVSVYYLVDTIKLTGITPDHVYTCYKEVKQRPPEAFVQSLRDTSSKYGYIDTADINNIKLPLRGRNFVEHDLPKKKAES